MSDIEKCLRTLGVLIAQDDVAAIELAENTINELLSKVPLADRRATLSDLKSGLLKLLDRRQADFAEMVFACVENRERGLPEEAAGTPWGSPEPTQIRLTNQKVAANWPTTAVG
jgi:hypothetical protein